MQKIGDKNWWNTMSWVSEKQKNLNDDTILQQFICKGVMNMSAIQVILTILWVWLNWSHCSSNIGSWGHRIDWFKPYFATDNNKLKVSCMTASEPNGDSSWNVRQVKGTLSRRAWGSTQTLQVKPCSTKSSWRDIPVVVIILAKIHQSNYFTVVFFL